jgi:gliding motility-associated-like protein
MKSVLSIFILCFCLGTISFGQDIHYSLQVINSNCNGFNDGSIQLNVVQENPPYTYLWNTGSTGSVITNLAPGNYSVTVSDSTGNDSLISITVTEKPCTLAVEIVFTPNSDGHNDTWEIANIEYYSDNLVLVYNRWGQKVFEHSGQYEPWDGRDLLGVPVPDNSYFYIVYGDRKDEKSIVKGCVSIIR